MHTRNFSTRRVMWISVIGFFILALLFGTLAWFAYRQSGLLQFYYYERTEGLNKNSPRPVLITHRRDRSLWYVNEKQLLAPLFSHWDLKKAQLPVESPLEYRVSWEGTVSRRPSKEIFCGMAWISERCNRRPLRIFQYV